MNYAFFEALSPDQAAAYLTAFLNAEREALTAWQPLAGRDGVEFDFAMTTLPGVLKWMVANVHGHWVPLGEDEPEWIRQAHPQGAFEFDEDSKSIILRAAYYLGECFARLPGHRWSTGNTQYVQHNMPVITGFRNDLELPPLVVMDNVAAKIHEDGKPLSKVDSMVDVWKNHSPFVA